MNELKDFKTLTKVWDDFFQNDNIHIICFDNDNLFGYYKDSKRAIYSTKFFQSDLLSEMPNSYLYWIEEQPVYYTQEIETKETETDYFEIIL